jgi:AraC-like ligand binding domain
VWANQSALSVDTVPRGVDRKADCLPIGEPHAELMIDTAATLWSSRVRMEINTKSVRREWSRYYRLSVCNSIEALHAGFVTHRYAKHAHDYLVVGLIESGAQAYWYRGARHVTPEGHVFLVNPGEPHTGESATTCGYVYRTLNPPMCESASGYAHTRMLTECCGPGSARLVGRGETSSPRDGLVYDGK